MVYEKPQDLWKACREGVWTRPTAGLAPGYAQANLVILPKEDAFDFLRLAQRNPKPIPLLEVLETGDWEPKLTAPGADLRTDLPAYRVYRNGELTEERQEIRDLWRDDLVSFLIGCSFTFETPLLAAGLPVRHIECGCNVPMYRTNRMCIPSGRFSGPMVVSMRPIPAHLVAKAVTVTARFPAVHGAPVHIGDPAALGIADVGRPDYGDPVPINPGEVPVFWACGVTPQAVALQSKPAFMITHAPGHMFVTSVLDEEIANS
ncbi:MAG TPA: putative hydro-lyase [Symbiobacteriaceae bacterium]|nr:putative hydro-lyase [Symbiobacteriaceae bacterium]